MTRTLSVAAIIVISGLLLVAQADARPAKPGLTVADRPADQGGVLEVTITASADDGGGADDVTEYRVHRRPAGGVWQFLRSVPAADQPTYGFEDSGLVDGRRYYYKVRASNGVLISYPAHASAIPLDNTPPRPPRQFTVEDHPGDQGSALDLHFVRSRDDGGGADDVRHYRISRRELGGSFEEIARIRATGADTYQRTDWNLTVGTTYIYRVRAYDGHRLSTPAEARGVPLDNVRPRPPRDVAVADVPDDNGGAVIVSWGASRHDGNGPDDVQSYEVRRKRAGGTFAFLKNVTATDATSYRFTDTGLDNNVLYTYKVRAFDGNFYSEAAFGGGKALDNRRPKPPRQVTVTDVPDDNGGAVTVSFRASGNDGNGSDDVRSYEVQRKRAGGSFAFLRKVTANDATSYGFTDTGLDNDIWYTYKVRAYDGTFYSKAALGGGKALDNRRPRPPREVTVTDVPDDNGGAVMVTFRASGNDGNGSDDVRSYEVQRKRAGGSFAFLRNVTATDATSYGFTDTGLDNDVWYTYRVRAYDGTFYSKAALGSGKALDNKRPKPPRQVTVTDVPDDNGGAVTVKFRASGNDGNGPDDVQSYEVRRKRAGGTFAFLRTITATDATTYRFTDSGLDDNVWYTYKIRAFDGKFYSEAALGGGKALDDTPPRPPSNFQVAVAENALGAADVSFDASPDDVVGHREVTRYDIFRKLAGTEWPTSPTRKVAATAAATYSIRDTGMVPGKRYWYRARAVGATGKSTYTGLRSIVANDTRVPRPPRTLTAEDRPDDNGQAVIVRWLRSLDDGANLNNVARYVVLRRLTSVFDTPVTRIRSVAATGGNAYTIIDASSELMNLRSYTYTVRAISDTGVQSRDSNEAMAVPQDNIILAAPTNLVASDRPGDSGGVIQLQFRRSTSEGGVGPPPPPPFGLTAEETAQSSGVYEVFRRQVGQSWPSTPRLTVSTSVSGDPITTVDTGVPNGVPFEYKVRYRVDTVISPFSNTAQATAVQNTTASVAAAQAELSVSIADAPDSVAAGESIRARAVVTGVGLSQVRLRWTVEGTEVWQQTAAVTGKDSYEASFTLAPAVEAGVKVRLIAVAEDADKAVESEEVSVRISD